MLNFFYSFFVKIYTTVNILARIAYLCPSPKSGEFLFLPCFSRVFFPKKNFAGFFFLKKRMLGLLSQLVSYLFDCGSLGVLWASLTAFRGEKRNYKAAVSLKFGHRHPRASR